MGESIVVLSPHSGRKEDVERGHLLSPFNFKALLDPLAVLVHHAVDDMNERLVTVEQAMSS